MPTSREGLQAQFSNTISVLKRLLRQCAMRMRKCATVYFSGDLQIRTPDDESGRRMYVFVTTPGGRASSDVCALPVYVPIARIDCGSKKSSLVSRAPLFFACISRNWKKNQLLDMMHLLTRREVFFNFWGLGACSHSRARERLEEDEIS